MKLIEKLKKIVGKEDKKNIDIADYTNALLLQNEMKLNLIGKKIAG